MALAFLPKSLLYEVLVFLSPRDLFTGIGASSRDLRATAIDLLAIPGYNDAYFGPLRFQSQSSSALLKLVLLSDFSTPKILRLGATFTDGGVFINSFRFWAQNLFEYNGTVYTANDVVSNVTVGASFLDDYFTNSFSERLHEDLYGLLELTNTWSIPQHYKDNVVPSDSFLTGQPPRLGSTFTPEEYSSWGKEEGPIYRPTISFKPPRTYFTDIPQSEQYALASHIGIARPAFATCPVRTLMVFTKQAWTPADLRQWYDLTTMEGVLKRTDLPPVSCSAVLNGYSYIEFSAAEGPLLWFQFTAYQATQAQIELKRRRVLRHTEVLLLDIDDRREEFRTTEKGIDVTYVLFAGKMLPGELRTVADIEAESSNDMTPK